MRSEDGYGAPEERYSPESVEGEFCEVDLPLYGVLRSSSEGSRSRQKERCGHGCRRSGRGLHFLRLVPSVQQEVSGS